MTSRYQPVSTDGDGLTRFSKIDDLRAKQPAASKRKGKAEAEKRLGEGRGKKKSQKMAANLKRLNINEAARECPLMM